MVFDMRGSAEGGWICDDRVLFRLSHVPPDVFGCLLATSPNVVHPIRANRLSHNEKEQRRLLCGPYKLSALAAINYSLAG